MFTAVKSFLSNAPSERKPRPLTMVRTRPQVAIQELVGHGSPAMTALYSHADFEQKHNAINGLPAMAFNNGEGD